MKYRVVNTLIMNIPIAASIALAAQLLATQTVVLNLFLLNFFLAYVISFFVGMLIPCVKLGVGFAFACKAKPDTLPFGLCVNVIVNLIYVVINCILLTYFNVCILNKAPVIAFFFGMISTFIPIYIVGYVVSFLWNTPAQKMTEKICKE